jgi:hypothetical protein
MMAQSTVVKVRRDGTIKLKDGSTNTYTVAYENGDLSFDGGSKADRIVIRDRGTIVGLRKGDDPVPSLTFTTMMRDFHDNSAGSLIDFLDNSGPVVLTSSGGTGYEQFLVDIEFTVEGTSHGDANDHVATAAKCLCTWSFSEGDPNTISVTAEIHGGVTYTEPT